MSLKIISFSIILSLFSLHNTVKAQSINDHLKPVESIYDLYDFQFEYYSTVRKVLFKGLSDSPKIRFQEMPSFTPENVLVIEFNHSQDKYFIVYHIGEKSIWYSKDRENVKVKKYKKEIDKTSVALIESLFKIAISQTKSPEKELRGNDGTNYFFSVRNYGMKSGKVWSPRKGSKMYELTAIGNTLKELVKSEQIMIRFDKKFVTKIEELILILKK